VTRITAYDAGGRIVATTLDRGLNPHAFDADYLAAQAACMESKGFLVTTRAQGKGVPPAYQFAPGSLSDAQARAAQDACEAVAAKTH
jgi:hypothetical protein